MLLQATGDSLFDARASVEDPARVGPGAAHRGQIDPCRTASPCFIHAGDAKGDNDRNDGANEGGFPSAYPNGNRGRYGPRETLADSHRRGAAGSCYGTQKPVKASVEKIASS